MNWAVLSDISTEDIIEGEIKPTKQNMKIFVDINILKAFPSGVYFVLLPMNWIHSCPIVL